MSAPEDCGTCAAESAALESERQRALRALDLADFEVNQARARLADIENKIANRHARQCRDHQEARDGRRAQGTP